jgi:hypothetical protein
MHIFFFACGPDSLWNPLGLPSSMCWVYFPRVKRPSREAGHSPPTCAEVKSIWICTSTPPYVLKAERLISSAQGQLFCAVLHRMLGAVIKNTLLSNKLFPIIQYIFICYLVPWKWRQWISPKHCCLFTELDDFLSQETEHFKSHTAETSQATAGLCFCIGKAWEHTHVGECMGGRWL